MAQPSPDLEAELRQLIAHFDAAAAKEGVRPAVYIVGAGSLVLEGLTTRATRDLDFICEERGKLFENQILPGGLHSHRVPAGLVSMPIGWRERSREARELGAQHVRVFIPDIHDRLVDKLSRGLATDWQDIAAVLEARPAGVSVAVLAERANSLLENPTSTVFDREDFRQGFERLRKLAGEKGLSVPALRS